MNFTSSWLFYVKNILQRAKYKWDAGNSSCLHNLFFSCDFFDTAQYYISALNVKGETSSVATIVIKSR